MNIQPTNSVQTPLDGTATNLDIIVNAFPLFPSTIEVKWTVYGEGFSKSGILTLPQSVVDQWGTDDTVVENYVLGELNLIKVEAPEPPITPEEPSGDTGTVEVPEPPITPEEPSGDTGTI